MMRGHLSCYPRVDKTKVTSDPRSGPHTQGYIKNVLHTMRIFLRFLWFYDVEYISRYKTYIYVKQHNVSYTRVKAPNGLVNNDCRKKHQTIMCSI